MEIISSAIKREPKSEEMKDEIVEKDENIVEDKEEF